MKNPPFEYHQPDTLEDAIQLLAVYGDEAKVLAGGQSLLPLMGLRLVRPSHVIDIGRVAGLGAISTESSGVSVGALVSHSMAERSEKLRTNAPLVHQAMPYVGHRAIRNRGTVCGSVAHADPAAEMPAVCRAAGASMIAVSSRGERAIEADEFFVGYLQTALDVDEILTEIRFPALAEGTGTAVVEVARRHGDYALVGLACSLTVESTITAAALSFFGAGSTPIRLGEVEQLLIGEEPNEAAFTTAAAAVRSSIEPSADVHGSANYRRYLAGVLTQRGLTQAASTVGVLA
ncbi:MAG: xanthine dehydrogenase family protein subunit M [Actinomycetota bacterium]|nr:xanthine dehydrogenase family protein subunit M [Actinomycetota bacterium]